MRPAIGRGFLISILVLLSGIGLLHSQEETQDKDRTLTLDNGMKVFLHEKRTFPLVNISVGVDVGSKDESAETNGLVHILEHCILFRGTETRTGIEIAQQVRINGAYLNAHTSHDLSVFEICLPSDRIDFALKNQKDILFRFATDQKNLEEEKQVIIEEINQIHDDPLIYATSLIYQNLFPDAFYQRPIYGEKEIIEAATPQQLIAFHRKYFVPSNCAMAVVGDFDLDEVEKKIRAVFGVIPDVPVHRREMEKVKPLEKDLEMEEKMDVSQAYLVLGVQGPEFAHPDQVAMDVLVEILGRQVRSHVNRRFPGQRSIVHSVSMGYNALKYGGAVLVYMRIEPDHVKTVERETIRFLKAARTLNYSKEDYPSSQALYATDYLENALNQIKFKAHQFNEEGLLIASAMAHYLAMKRELPQASYIERVSGVTTTDLRRTAGRYLSSNHYVSVSILPDNEDLAGR